MKISSRSAFWLTLSVSQCFLPCGSALLKGTVKDEGWTGTVNENGYDGRGGNVRILSDKSNCSSDLLFLTLISIFVTDSWNGGEQGSRTRGYGMFLT